MLKNRKPRELSNYRCFRAKKQLWCAHAESPSSAWRHFLPGGTNRSAPAWNMEIFFRNALWNALVSFLWDLPSVFNFWVFEKDFITSLFERITEILRVSFESLNGLEFRQRVQAGLSGPRANCGYRWANMVEASSISTVLKSAEWSRCRDDWKCNLSNRVSDCGTLEVLVDTIKINKRDRHSVENRHGPQFADH